MQLNDAIFAADRVASASPTPPSPALFTEWMALIIFAGIVVFCAVLAIARPRNVFCSQDFEAQMRMDKPPRKAKKLQ